jgi:hypothetical protein
LKADLVRLKKAKEAKVTLLGLTSEKNNKGFVSSLV